MMDELERLESPVPARRNASIPLLRVQKSKLSFRRPPKVASGAKLNSGQWIKPVGWVQCIGYNTDCL